MKRHFLGLTPAVLVVAGSFADTPARAQGAKADYERDESLQKLFADKVGSSLFSVE